ncbi:hypothetical protein TB2_028357 [Malus domestica]
MKAYSYAAKFPRRRLQNLDACLNQPGCLRSWGDTVFAELFQPGAGIENGSARKQAGLSELENQLAEEKKTRLKQETRAFAAVSHQSSASSFRERGAQKTVAEKKPPLAPPRTRLPLRRLSNFPPPTIICFTEKNLHCCQTSNSNNATGSSA